MQAVSTLAAISGARRAARVAPCLALLIALGGCTASSPSAGPGAASSSVSPTPPPTQAPASAPSPTPSPETTLGPPVHQIQGWLHVVGTSLADERNDSVRLISILVPGMNRGAGSPDRVGSCPGWQPPPAAAYADIPSFGFNSVRLGIAWANLEPAPPTTDANGVLVHHYNQAYLRALDAVVQGFVSHGVAVILDMVQVRWSPAFRNIALPLGGVYHCGAGMPAWLYPNGGGVRQMVAAERGFFADPSQWSGLADAWAFLAGRFAGQPLVVGADILNEPYDLLAVRYPGTETLTPAGLNLRRFYETVGTAIDRVNPHLLLVYEDKQLSSGKTALVGRPRLPNAVYSVHMYPTSWGIPHGRALTQFYADRAATWDVPMWIGEFTAFGETDPGGPQPNWEADLRAFLTFCKKRNIGWTIASYSGSRLLIRGTTTPKPGIVDILRTGL